ncbi:MAG: hypothetical protein ACK5AL_03360 [Planctomycetota bacterium]
MLLSLAAASDRIGAMPDAVPFLARLLGCSPRTARTYRDELVVAGLLRRTADGRLVVDAAALDAWKARAVADFAGRGLRFAFDAVPRAALGWGLSTAELRAVAVVFGDAVGAKADRSGVRTDAERAELAGVGRRYIVAARAQLVAHGCRAISRRVGFRLPDGSSGQLVLRRVALPDDAANRRQLSRRPAMMAGGATAAVAAAATSGSARTLVAGRGTCGRWTAGAPSATKEQSPSATAAHLPISTSEVETPSPRTAVRTDGVASPPVKDGPHEGVVAKGAAVVELAAVAQAGGDLLAILLPPPAATSEAPADREQAGRKQAEQLLADGARLARAVADGRTADLLAGFGVFDRADRVPAAKAGPVLDRRRQGLALRLATVAGGARGAALVVVRVAAAVLRARGVRQLGAVIIRRLEAYVASADLRRAAGTWCELDAAAIAAVVRGERTAPRARGERTDAAPIARDHSAHDDRARRTATGAAVAAARVGDNRLLLRFAERGADLDAVAAALQRPVADLQAVVEVERAARAARFAAGARRTA